MIADFFKGLENERVLVVGDIMLDRYLFGEVHRISPEAPVPIISLTKDMSKIGGAGNVALNVAGLGSKVRLLSLVGSDESGAHIRQLLSEEQIDEDGILISDSRKTTVKSRIISSGQHLMRIDSEDKFDVTDQEIDLLWDKYQTIVNEFNPTLVLLQDYDKGLLSSKFLSKILEFNNEHKIFTSIDPKKRDFSIYAPCDLLKPNLKEFSEYLGQEVHPIYDELLPMTEKLRSDLSISSVVITLSEHGIFINSANRSVQCGTKASEIVDVCGAGDAVFAVISLALKMGISHESAGQIANAAGALVCSKVGVVAVELSQLKRETLDQ